MLNADKYYKKTESNKPTMLLRKFFAYGYNEKIDGNIAIDLGCGAGNDTVELINKNGFFVGNFLGKEDDWKNRMTTVEKEELLSYFKSFNILYFSEEKFYKDTALGKNKFWHIYTVIAKNKNKHE